MMKEEPQDKDPADEAKAGATTFLGRLQSWHVAGTLLVLFVGGLTLYAYWPALAGSPVNSSKPEAAEEPGEVPTSVEAVVLGRTDFPLRVEATGHLAPWRRAKISAETGGQVVEETVEEGDYVSEGELLIRLDDRQERIALKEAQANLLDARAQHAGNAQRGAALQDTTELHEARRALRQAEKAFGEDEISKERLEAARRRFETARLTSGKQRREVQAAASGVTQAQQQVDQARLQLSLTRVEAPFAGRVSDVKVEVGQRVGAGEDLLTLLQDSRMKVQVDVLESNLVQIEDGASARVVVPSLGGAAFRGEVISINPSVDPQSGTGRVTVTIPNPQGRLYAGLFARAQVETQRLEDKLVVPEEAILMRQGRDLVFRLAGGQAKWTYVTVGERSGGYAAIEDGLSEGDTVAVSGHFALAHDAPARAAEVRPVDPE